MQSCTAAHAQPNLAISIKAYMFCHYLLAEQAFLRELPSGILCFIETRDQDHPQDTTDMHAHTLDAPHYNLLLCSHKAHAAKNNLDLAGCQLMMTLEAVMARCAMTACVCDPCAGNAFAIPL